MNKTIFALATFALVGCKGSTEPVGGNQPQAINQLPRALTAAEVKLVASANTFSFALLKRVSAAEPDKNVFLSPLSASFSLGMTLNGARGGTFDAMRQALQVGGATQDEINSGYRGLMDLLDSVDPAVQLDIANSIWYRNTMTFSTLFTDAAKTYFDATVQGLNFDDQAAKGTINAWVSQKTNGKIPTIIDEIRPEHVMFLINAIYFKGSWRVKFDKDRTRSDVFKPSTGAQQSMQMMTLDDTIGLGSVADAQVIDLPYGNTAYSMTVVLPNQGTSLDAFVGSLTEAKWTSMVASVHRGKHMLEFPKLSMKYERTLNDDLTALGMGVAFTDAANFSAMTPTGTALSLSFVKQKTAVDIDEEGTEAAAVTVTGVQLTSAPLPIRVDRPYLIAIRERLSGTILFIGKVNRMP